MFQRFLSMLLCTCMLAGSVPGTAYAAVLNEGTQAEVVAETEEESEGA